MFCFLRRVHDRAWIFLSTAGEIDIDQAVSREPVTVFSRFLVFLFLFLIVR